MTNLNAAWQSASQDMYNASQQTEGAPDQGPANNAGDNVTDVEFEEVKDEKK